MGQNGAFDTFFRDNPILTDQSGNVLLYKGVDEYGFRFANTVDGRIHYLQIKGFVASKDEGDDELFYLTQRPNMTTARQSLAGFSPIPTCPAMSTDFRGWNSPVSGLIQSQVFRSPNGTYAYAYKITNTGGAPLTGLMWAFHGNQNQILILSENLGNLGNPGESPPNAGISNNMMFMGGNVAPHSATKIVVVLSPAPPLQQLVQPNWFRFDPTGNLPLAYAP